MNLNLPAQEKECLF